MASGVVRPTGKAEEEPIATVQEASKRRVLPFVGTASAEVRESCSHESGEVRTGPHRGGVGSCGTPSLKSHPRTVACPWLIRCTHGQPRGSRLRMPVPRADDVPVRDSTEPLRVTYDDAVDAAYIYLVPEIEAGSVARTVPVDGGDDPWMVNLDVDSDGRIIGLEVLAASKRLSLALLAELD